jgi:hypothetical protein
MIESDTKQPLRVRTDGSTGPYVDVPLAQLDRIKRLLDARGIYHWASEQALSYNGGPYMIVVNFGLKGEAARVQSVLDELQ